MGHPPPPHLDEAAGLLRIANVAELTGVPEPTLRAWERRYGVPTPERTPSGYRLYGAREVAQVREMKRLLANGISAAQAARTLRERPPAGQDERPAGDPYGQSRDAILEAVARFDEESLDLQLRALLFMGPTVSLLDHVIVPVLRTIGDRWHSGELSVAHEHLASQRLGTLVRDVARLGPGWDGGPRVLMASFADDEHDLGLLATGARLATWGFRPVFLGARTPPDAVAAAVHANEPRAVALSCTVTPARARARELLEGYASACAPVPWIVGGAGASALGEQARARGGLMAPEDPRALRSLFRHVTSGRRRGEDRKGKRR
jgi:DNA-binding transcriptional MerR regulator/methylmalonyl-CoA mutase cobalamin-binding subunit